jgi:hypothetical protein
MSWQSTITDPDELKVFQALDTDKGNWRTVWGVARQTGLSENRVSEILSKYDLKLTTFANVPSISGSALVGLIEKVGA